MENPAPLIANTPDEIFKTELIDLVHFIRTPLASIKIAIEILNDVVPELLSSYDAQRSNNPAHLSTIDSSKISKLKQIMSGITKESDRINDYIQAIDFN